MLRHGRREVVVKGLITMVLAGVFAAVGLGCRDTTPPPPNVPVPSADNPDAVRTHDPIKPLPPQPRDVEQNP